MARNITLAFAGSTPVAKKTVAALLDDYLGFGPVDADGYPEPSENNIRLIFPASTEHYNDALQTVVDWSEYADLPYEVVLAKGDRDKALETLVSDAEMTHEVANVDKQVIDLLKDAVGEAFLVLLWNDEDEHCEILLDLADTAGIKALDLTAALDDLSFADPADEPEKEPEPEPEPEEKPTRGRRGSRKAAEVAEEPAAEEKPARGRRGRKETPLADSDEVPLTEDSAAEPEAAPEPEPTPEAPKRRGRARAAAPAEEEKVPLAKEVKEEGATASLGVAKGLPNEGSTSSSVDAEYLSGALQSIFLHLQAVDAASAYKNLGDPEESPVTALAREALEHVSLGAPAAVEEPVEEVKRGRGRPRTKEATVGYLVNGDGVYRKAGRGRPKSGEEKVDLTAEQVADLAEKGLILDED